MVSKFSNTMFQLISPLIHGQYPYFHGEFWADFPDWSTIQGSAHRSQTPPAAPSQAIHGGWEKVGF